MRVLAACVALTAVTAACAIFQIRVECDRLAIEADAERALRFSLQQRLERGSAVLSRMAVASDTGELASAEADAKTDGTNAGAVLRAVRDGIAARDQQSEAHRALLREIETSSGISRERRASSLPALTRQYRRATEALGRIRQLASAGPASQAQERQQEIALALAAAQQSFRSAAQAETGPIRDAERRQRDSVRRIALLSLVVLAAVVLGIGLLLLILRNARQRFRREFAFLEEQYKGSLEKTDRILEWMREAATRISGVAIGLAAGKKPAERGPRQISPHQLKRKPDESETNTVAPLLEAAANAVLGLTTTSLEIGRVTEQIRGVAFKTKILALNAAIEATHAGEQGAGFGIVAAEVKSLAADADACTAEIDARVKQLESRIAEISGTLTQIRESASRPRAAVEIALAPIQAAEPSFTSERQQLAELASEMERFCGKPAPVLVSRPKPRKSAGGRRR